MMYNFRAKNALDEIAKEDITKFVAVANKTSIPVDGCFPMKYLMNVYR